MSFSIEITMIMLNSRSISNFTDVLTVRCILCNLGNTFTIVQLFYSLTTRESVQKNSDNVVTV